MSIYHNLEKITELALNKAREHNCNYNVIICNPDENGQFSQEKGSTYEMVADSYFEKPRANVKLINTTGEIMLQEARDIVELHSKAQDIFESSSTYIDFTEAKHVNKMMQEMPQRVPQYIRSDRKVGNNEPCTCGSNIKYKKCCK